MAPVIRWRTTQSHLVGEAVEQAKSLIAEKKDVLLKQLIDSKEFGLEAVKGTLFQSLAKQDEAALLRIRAVGFHPPDQLALRRLQTIGIMIRHLRQESP